jgi:4-hydroxy-tetrahydrodipicolinate reductase
MEPVVDLKKIKVGLWGFGRTGRLVAKEFFENEDFELQWIVRKTKPTKSRYASHLFGCEHDAIPIFGEQELTADFFKQNEVDVIVDFSSVNGYEEYEAAVEQGIRIISAISDYTEQDICRLKKYAEKTAVLYSPNITLGINFLFVASQLFQKIAPYADIEIVEEHFREKKEISGTALKIAKVLGLKSERINSVRVGGIVGKHEIIFGLQNQTVRLTHESINKAAFGRGAIFAAKWLIHKTKGFYSMEEIITEMIVKELV